MNDPAARRPRPTPEKMLARIDSQRAEIRQIFRDLDYWNRMVRRENEPPIDPDPDGGLAECLLVYARTEAQILSKAYGISK